MRIPASARPPIRSICLLPFGVLHFGIVSPLACLESRRLQAHQRDIILTAAPRRAALIISDTRAMGHGGRIVAQQSHIGVIPSRWVFDAGHNRHTPMEIADIAGIHYFRWEYAGLSWIGQRLIVWIPARNIPVRIERVTIQNGVIVTDIGVVWVARAYASSRVDLCHSSLSIAFVPPSSVAFCCIVRKLAH